MTDLSPRTFSAILNLTLLAIILAIGILLKPAEAIPEKAEAAEHPATDIHVESVREAESIADQSAVSPAGAIGSMQVMPPTADDPGFGIRPARKNLDGSYDLNDIDRLGEEYLHAMLERYDGNFEAALIAYNAGPGNADRWLLNGKSYDILPDSKQTREYVERAYTVYHHLLAEVAL